MSQLFSLFTELTTVDMATSSSALTLAKKLEILKSIENSPSPNFTEISKKFGVHRSTVSKISKNKDRLKEESKDANLNRKRKRAFKEENVDESRSGRPSECPKAGGGNVISLIFHHLPSLFFG